MDKVLAKKISEATAEALRGVADRFGLDATVNGGSYDGGVGTFKPKVEFKAKDSPAREFARWAGPFGLDPADFGREFVLGGMKYRIVGLRPAATKRPVMAESGGRTYLFSADVVAKLLGRTATGGGGLVHVAGLDR